MKLNLYKILFELYSFLFIYTMINREFLFFGIDLRFIILIIGIILLFFALVTKNKSNKKLPICANKIYKVLFILFFWSLLSNISWLWNGLEKFPKEIINQNILILNNFFAVIIFKKYYYCLEEERIKKNVIFSCIVLVISIVLTGLGLSLSQISGSDARSIVHASISAAEHKNIFGGNFRLAGYAEDPNYASIFLVLGSITSLQLYCKNRTKYFLCALFLLAFCFSCSKTILLSFFLGIIYLIFIYFFRRKGFPKILNLLFSIFIISLIIFLPVSRLLSTHTTMATRFKMWNMAKELFLSSPIIGNGINAFKSYINSNYNGLWYVQCHSTYWQLLSETGLVGFLIFINLMVKCLNNYNLTKYNKYLLFIFFVFIINFETIQLQVFVYIIFIISLFGRNNAEEGF